MLNLDHEPPRDPTGQPLPITRTLARGITIGVITSDHLVGTQTHFWGGRTVPCTAPDCDACAGGAPFRWHGYVAAWHPAQNLHYLFEFTATAADTLIKYRHEHGTLRGCSFRSYRPAQRPNSRVQIDVAVWQGKPSDLPNEPDLPAVLSRLWNIPLTQISTPEIQQSVSAMRVLNSQIELLRTRDDNNGRKNT